MWTFLVGGLLAVGQAPDTAPPPLATSTPDPVACAVCQEPRGHFLKRLWKAYCEEFTKKNDNGKKEC